MKKYLYCCGLVFLLIMSGCNTKSSLDTDSHIAYVSHDRDGEYEAVINDLNLGNLMNYHLRLPKADPTWITIWVEAYRDGELIKPHLSELSYGFSPNEVDEGNMGLGILKPEDGEELFFLYAPGIKDFPHTVQNNPLEKG